MTTENEWVKLPNPAPKMLPKGTRARSIGCTSEYVALEDAPRGAFDQFVGPWKGRHWTHKGIGFLIEVWLPPGYRFEGSEVVKDEAKRSYCHKRHGGYTQLCDENCRDDDLGDTPEHLKPLLREARERVAGTVVTEAIVRGWDVLWNPDPTKMGYPTFMRADPSRCGYRSDVPPGTAPQPRSDLRTAILDGRCYPTADARRIGREEFGMVFDACFDSIDRAADSVTEAIAKALQVPLALLQPERDSRPKCVACEQPMDPRRDGDQTCSPACLQAHQRSERDREAREKFEASEKAYLDCRSRDRGAYTSVLEERIEQAQSQRRDLESNIARDIPRRRTYAAAALLKSANLRPPGPGPKPLNPAALPGVAGVRGKRKASTTAPAAWPEGAGDDYEL